ncbi:hypothetical protein T552_02179 [Pneumocystis carinii B80]|uniref:ATP-dependent DNA helicase II subunit 1 n=1 Tax=Pneumocystis carinii (strain B80) TaxID=1408658 RepID=A0A0W4ZH85_PNEC8|nr:hypothetical protein T552_02179 [Pneumocystis carinii B80]KTW27739.1 hypothetical protein T552_02179 [Pneumocystis carinii B80]
MEFQENFEKNDDIEKPEKKNQEDYVVDEALLFLIDVSLLPETDEEVSTIAKTALIAAYKMLIYRVISKPTISFGILLYGTRDTNIEEFPLYSNLYLILDLNVQSGSSIKNFKILLSDDAKVSKIIIPTTRHVRLFNILEYANNMFNKLNSSYKIKRIFLITHNDDPSLGSQEYKNSTIASIRNLSNSGITIEPFFINGKKMFNFDNFYKDVLYISKNIDKIENHLTYEILDLDQMVDTILKRQSPKRFLFECPLQIAPNLDINVRGYILFRKKAPPKTHNVYIKSEEPQIVKTTVNYICQETSNPLKNEDIKMAYDFGGKKILFSEEQMNLLQFYEQDPVIRILGFKSFDQLHFWENVHPSYFLYPIDKKNLNSSDLFASLARTLYKLDKIAIAWFRPYRNSNPRISALVSNFDSNKKDDNDEFPRGLFAIILPFLDDIRQNPEQTSAKAPDPLIDKMSEIIERLMIDSYNPLHYENPGMQWTYKKLSSIVLGEDPYVDTIDKTIPDYYLINKKAGSFILQWNQLLGNSSNSYEETSSYPSKKQRIKADD